MTNNIPFPEQAQEYLAAIIRSSDDAILSKDLNGNITSWNPGAERIFGYTPEEAIGKHISILIPPELLSEEDYILGNVRQGKPIDHFETRRRTKDGRMVAISVTVSPIKNASGKIIGASKVARDISDRIRAERALQELSEKKDDFLANMSHELRTPMNAVVGLANLLKMTSGMPAQAIKYVETLKISADNLMDLINDLLDFAKIEAGSLEIENVEFNLTELVEKAVSVANIKAREKKLNLYVNSDLALNRYYMGDPLRIHQVLMNLLSNAVKFTEAGSVEIDIAPAAGSSSDETMITIKVSDTGIGIASDKLDVIFEKFIQADSSITRRYGGSGLGLAITKACVEMMRGTVRAESELGLGTTFTVVLPLGNTTRLSEIESFSANAIPSMPKQRKNILLVEDYEPNILVAGSLLEQLGYNYEIAKNGLDALRKFIHGDYDVILMDVQMHELDGLEATRKIRAIEAEKNIPRTPIIAMTAHVKEQDKDKCLSAGMDDFIPKPFEPSMLVQKLGRYMKPKSPDKNGNDALDSTVL